MPQNLSHSTKSQHTSPHDDVWTRHNRESNPSKHTKTRDTWNFWTILIAYVLISSVCVRIYQYLFHKDLWLDEASLSFSITHTSWQELFFAPLPFTQSTPLGFLVWTKAMYELFGASEYVLYFLPFVCSLGTLFVALKIAQMFDDRFTQALFMLLVGGSLGLLHYSTEFKQYGIEAFLGFLLLYLYMRRLRLSVFVIVSLVAMLFSHTIIFVAIACIAGYMWQHKDTLASFLRANLIYIALLGVCFGLYYVLYLRYQAAQGFYTYWAEFFLPLNPLDYPAYITHTLLGIYLGFTPFARGIVIPLYMALSCLGIVVLYKKRRDLFVVVMSSLGIYVGLSLLRIYPFGHEGIIGGRLSLYMSGIFFLICALGGGAIYARIRHNAILRVMSVLCLIVFLLCPMAYRHIRVMTANTHHIQQTHAFIAHIAARYTPQSCVFVYTASQRAFGYYTYLDALTIPYATFDADLTHLRQNLTQNKCQHIWILASHFPKEPWERDLTNLAHDIDNTATIHTDTGSMLIHLSHKGE